MYPFDTGAFEAGLYDEYFDKRSELEDFELDSSLTAAQKLVSSLYTDNKEYYDGRTRKNVEIPQRQFEFQGLHELARIPGSQSNGKKRDERSSAVEVQISESLSLKNSVLAIILPEPYLDDPDIISAVARWSVKEVKTYPTIHNQGSEAWVGQIYMIVRELYTRLGFIK